MKFLDWFTTDDSSKRELKFLQKVANYSDIEVELGRERDGDIGHKGFSGVGVREEIKTLREQLELHSVATLKASKLKRIIICGDLAIMGKAVGGLCRADSNSIYLSVKSGQNLPALAIALQHELFHCIDYYDDIGRYRDNEWEKLNEFHFSYVGESWEEKYGKKDQRSTSATRLGFISFYALKAVHEDKAELFAHMITKYKLVEELRRDDSILSTKVERMRMLLSRVSPDFNSDFWQRREGAPALMPVVPTTVVSLIIWAETVRGHRQWFIKRDDNSLNRIITFYSMESFRNCLKALNIEHFDDELTGVMFIGKKNALKARIPNSILREFNLL